MKSASTLSGLLCFALVLNATPVIAGKDDIYLVCIGEVDDKQNHQYKYKNGKSKVNTAQKIY